MLLNDDGDVAVHEIMSGDVLSCPPQRESVRWNEVMSADACASAISSAGHAQLCSTQLTPHSKVGWRRASRFHSSCSVMSRLRWHSLPL